ncbi:MAG: ABC transporter substrate-binding protein [Bdellovibrionota bacterium]
MRSTVASEKGRLTPEALDKKLKEVIGPMFNFEEMARRSVGAYWDKGSPEEQHEYVELFGDLLARTYLKRIKQQVENTQIQSMTEKVEGDKARVFSKILSDGQTISMECRLLLEAGDWKIYDVLIEGVGLITNYRNEFPGIIRQEGFKGLNAKLRAKAENRTSEAGPKGEAAKGEASK